MLVPDSPIRVLLADDEPDIRLLVRSLLEADGRFDVVAEAGDGRAAIDLTVAEHPDAVVLDLRMPEMDGFEALPRVREAWPDTKILVLSAYDEADRVRDLGGDEFLQKLRVVDAPDVLAGLVADC